MTVYLDWELKSSIGGNGPIFDIQPIHGFDGSALSNSFQVVRYDKRAAEHDTQTGALVSLMNNRPYGEFVGQAADWRMLKGIRSATQGQQPIYLYRRRNSGAATQQELWGLNTNNPSGTWEQQYPGGPVDRKGVESFVTPYGLYFGHNSATPDEWQLTEWGTPFPTVASGSGVLAEIKYDTLRAKAYCTVRKLGGPPFLTRLVSVDMNRYGGHYGETEIFDIPTQAEGWPDNFRLMNSFWVDGMEGSPADGEVLIVRDDPGSFGFYVTGYTLDMSDPLNGGVRRTESWYISSVDYGGFMTNSGWGTDLGLAYFSGSSQIWGTKLNGLSSGMVVGRLRFHPV